MSLRDHFARVTPQAYGALRLSLQILDDERLPYALVGGWAVFAYGSRLPSVDTDLMLGRQAARRFRQALVRQESEDKEGPGRHIELLAMDERNELHGFDWELETIPAYVPADILSGRCHRIAIPLPDGPVESTVPHAPELAFMKLKALHDRAFDYLAVTDPRYMARVNPSDRPLIAQQVPGHYLRKAGKDLADVAFLCTDRTDLQAALHVVPDLQERLKTALARIPVPIYEYGLELTAQTGGAAWIETHTQTTAP